jgi:uncharacterized membrane protein (UPF0127 family)
MMAKLMKTDIILLPDLQVAQTLWSRMKGLLGTRDLSREQGLWIHHCNSIHTFFMNYAIDCVFVDRELKVKALKKNIRPGRMTMPVWGADSVIEMSAGQIDRLGLQQGDQLHVGA